MYRQFLFVTFSIACIFYSGHSQTITPQLVAGQPVNAFMGGFNINRVTDCSPSYDFAWTVDSTQNPFVSGVDFVVVVTDITAPSNSIIVSGNPVSIGDTIRFDTANIVPVYMFAPGGIEFEYRLLGTPTTVGENYVCDNELAATLGFCSNSIIVMPLSQDTCEVETANSVVDPLRQGWDIYPNPAQSSLQLRSRHGHGEWTAVELWDLQGRMVREWESGEMIQLDEVKGGMYFVKIRSFEGEELQRLLIE